MAETLMIWLATCDLRTAIRLACHHWVHASHTAAAPSALTLSLSLSLQYSVVLMPSLTLLACLDIRCCCAGEMEFSQYRGALAQGAQASRADPRPPKVHRPLELTPARPRCTSGAVPRLT